MLGKGLRRWHPIEGLRHLVGSIAPLSMSRHRLSGLGAGFWPELEVEDLAGEYVVRVQAQGMDRQALQVDVSEDVLTIRGQHKSQTESRRHGGRSQEQVVSAFSRSFTLPAAVKAAETKATFREGVLEIRLPKVKPTQVHRVSID